MELNDEIRIDAPREQVYAALNDAEVLRKCIPGCEELEQLSETELVAMVVTRIGPVKAKFTGRVTLSDLNPPQGYTISGEGKGGAAGFAKGGATISLDEDGDGTIMRYAVQINVGGKLAQLGGRLIEGTAKKLSADFFNAFKQELAPPEAEEAGATEPVIAEEPRMSASTPLVMIIGAASVLAVLYFLFEAF
ncbi:MAG: carbon monoxide dehydrogenase subunit G [Alphaproteobacteria bacterium]